MNFFKGYLRVLSLLEKTILVAGFATMLTITFMNIVDRKTGTDISLGLNWSTYEELTCALFLLVTLVGAAMASRHGLHLGLSLITDLFPKAGQKAVCVLGGVAGMIFSLMLVNFGHDMVLGEIAMNMKTAALGWPEWIFGSFVPIGGAFLALEFANYIIFSFTRESAVWRV